MTATVTPKVAAKLNEIEKRRTVKMIPSTISCPCLEPGPQGGPANTGSANRKLMGLARFGARPEVPEPTEGLPDHPAQVNFTMTQSR